MSTSRNTSPIYQESANSSWSRFHMNGQNDEIEMTYVSTPDNRLSPPSMTSKLTVPRLRRSVRSEPSLGCTNPIYEPDSYNTNTEQTNLQHTLNRREMRDDSERYRTQLDDVEEFSEPPLDYSPEPVKKTPKTPSVRPADRPELLEPPDAKEDSDSGLGTVRRESQPISDTKEHQENEALLGNSTALDDEELEEHPSCFEGLGERITRVTKVLTYMFLLVSVMGCVLISRATLLYMAQQYGSVTTAQIEEQHWKDHYAYLLAICLSLPDVTKVVSCSFSLMFGTEARPLLSVVIVFCVREIMHVISVYGFVFKVLPFVDSTSACALMMATGLIPFIANTISTWQNDSPNRTVRTSGYSSIWAKIKSLIRRYLNVFKIIFLVIQIGSISLCLYCTIVYKDGYKPILSNKTEFLIWSVVFLLVVPIRWIENHFEKTVDREKDSDDVNQKNVLCTAVISSRLRSQGKNKMMLIASILRIITAVLILKFYFEANLGNPISAFSVSTYKARVRNNIYPQAMVYPTFTTNQTENLTGYSKHTTVRYHLSTSTLPSNDSSSVNNNTTQTNVTNVTGIPGNRVTMSANLNYTTTRISDANMNAETSKPSSLRHTEEIITLYSSVELAAVHIISTWLCYHFAQLACKLCMQTVAFALPLCLAGPVGVVVLLFVPNFATVFLFSHQTITLVLPELGQMQVLILAAFVSGFISQMFLCRHVWTEMPRERLSFAEKLFTLPHYCSPLLDLSLLHSRRRMDVVEQSQPLDTNNFPIIKACATMWHENRKEMRQFLQSVFKVDMDQSARRGAKYEMHKDIEDYYEFEAHILFDDALTDETHTEKGEDGVERAVKTGRRIPNEYVQQLAEMMDEAVSLVYHVHATLLPPDKYKTPYGARLVWTLPGGNNLIAHLKDKSKIKVKKRWSQVMYMYYLLGFKLSEDNIDSLHTLPPDEPKDISRTYLLALDGDVDFEPNALLFLIDRMKKNPNVAAACGRIKPKGSGPVVWYQKFEYAVGHWLQKSAEHIFGCVLCSPGCFSLFRGSAVRRVLKTYTRKPKTARHHLQYDQGEDRWLCTLLLQKGYKIEYVAASEALTYAPEAFTEFFNQRRRWLPSTMANIADLLQSRGSTVTKNRYISNIYMLYLLTLFVSSILGPATVLLSMESSIVSVFRLPGWSGYLITFGPTVGFAFVCLRLKSSTQIQIAIMLSTLFALVMMAVIAGTLVSVAQEGWVTPNALFLYVLIGSFVLAGILHPYECSDLAWGFLYFLCIPAGYLFLVIYSICNLHITTWGTRETKSTDEQQREFSVKEEIGDPATIYLAEAARTLQARMQEDSRSEGCCSCIPAMFRRMRSSLTNSAVLLFILQALQRLEKERTPNCDKASSKQLVDEKKPVKTSSPSSDDGSSSVTSIYDQTTEWVLDDNILPGKVKHLESKETQFWEHVIEVYLNPKDKNSDTEAKRVIETMIDFRNKSAFAFFFINGLWLVIMTALQEVKQELNIVIHQKYGAPIIVHPLGMLFLAIFALLLLLQITAMIKHRYGTALHVLAFTNIKKQLDVVDYAKLLLVPGDDDKNDDCASSSVGDSLYDTKTTAVSNVRPHPTDLTTPISSLQDHHSLGSRHEMEQEAYIQDDFNRRHRQYRQRARHYDAELHYRHPRKVINLESQFKQTLRRVQRDYETYRQRTVGRRKDLPGEWFRDQENP